MSLFARTSPGMQAMFPSSGYDIPRPKEVTDVVHLVKEFPARALDMQTATRQSFSSLSVVSPVIAFAAGTGPPTQPQDTFDELVFGHIGHTFVGFSRLRISLVDPSGAAVVQGLYRLDGADPVGQFSPVYGGLFNNNSTQCPRTILIPPGWQLQAFGETQAVAYIMTLAYYAARRPLVDMPLRMV
jgi:hypothetical protein